ncbi:MAG: hypothetical protein CBD16_02745 [Betaproteobacteria bacterium TMED156]|nr:MAG: hypothetical protein CBD16_02745 [Betaproteobacteria bacterium TMED156]|tara:strand:- start:785 stop:1477 length:693 start_codon:yes stop_codon:yes gene_type:complete
MSFLVHNLPPVEVYVKKEFLYDHQKGHGELTPGVWISVKSVMGKALYFETLLTDYGACFDKLPISAFVWKENYDKENQLPLDHLQIWDCFDYDLTVIKKPLLCDCEFFGKDKKMHTGEYIFTIDNCHREQNVLNTNFSEHDPEHKSFNIIKMHNGQFAAQPNNRVIFTDQSLVHPDRKIPDFKVCSQNYTVENTPKWSVGDTDEWQYKTKDEKEYLIEEDEDTAHPEQGC